MKATTFAESLAELLGEIKADKIVDRLRPLYDAGVSTGQEFRHGLADMLLEARDGYFTAVRKPHLTDVAATLDLEEYFTPSATHSIQAFLNSSVNSEQIRNHEYVWQFYRYPKLIRFEGHA